MTMEYRAARFTADGRIDCEVCHPRHGWIPFTADPEDSEPHGRELFAEIEANGDAAAYEPPPPEPVAAAEVDAERDRRMVAGVTVEVSGYGPIPLRGGAADQTILLALKDTARDLIAEGVTDPVLIFRDAQNAMHQLTPGQMAELADAGKQYVSDVYEASWALKDAAPIPLDFASDAHWP